MDWSSERPYAGWLQRMRRFVEPMADLRTLCGFLLALVACSTTGGSGTSDSGAVSQPAYIPCNGEPGACTMATRFGGVSGDGCLCTYYCQVDKDCPVPTTGTATPVCQPYGDFAANGHTADCRLPCDASTVCPNGMSCSPSGCIGPISK